MSEAPEQQHRDEGTPKLLGSLLYGNGLPAVPESEWTAIVQAIGAGNEAALRELYGRTHRIVFTLILRIVKDPLTAEEVAVDVYHDVWRRAATYEPSRGSVVAWLMNQTRSRAIDRVRFERRKKRGNGHPAHAAIDDWHDSMADYDRSTWLTSALNALTVEERLAIETAYFQELTYAEVAERLQSPLGTIKTRIRSGLTKLRALLMSKESL